jgi:hypothetical protein
VNRRKVGNSRAAPSSGLRWKNAAPTAREHRGMGVAIGTAASLGERRSTHTSPARIVQSNVQLTITRRRQLGARRGIRIDKAGRQGLRIADSQREAHSSPHRRFDATRPRGPTAGALRPARRHLANRLERCCLERSPRCRRRYALPCKQTSPRHRVKRIHTSVLGPTSPPPPIGCPLPNKASFDSGALVSAAATGTFG